MRKGIPAKLSAFMAPASRSLLSPLMLRRLCEGEMLGVGWITLMSIWSVVSPAEFRLSRSDLMEVLGTAPVSGPQLESWEYPPRGVPGPSPVTRSGELLAPESFSCGKIPFTATIREWRTELGK